MERNYTLTIRINQQLYYNIVILKFNNILKVFTSKDFLLVKKLKIMSITDKNPHFFDNSATIFSIFTTREPFINIVVLAW